MTADFWFGLVATVGAVLAGVRFIVRAEVTPLTVRVESVEKDVERHEIVIEKLRSAEAGE